MWLFDLRLHANWYANELLEYAKFGAYSVLSQAVYRVKYCLCILTEMTEELPAVDLLFSEQIVLSAKQFERKVELQNAHGFRNVLVIALLCFA